ncbi:MAG TPA: phage baseplate assembly protein V, partial [Ornithinimicrobium sp.]|nr:phage baseplate assembly protein V [Ornithinimicrobium sp.]
DRVDDPEGRGRVQVRLVAYPDLVTGWAPVLSAGSGPGKGLVALPDAGDTVLALLPGGDPAHAVVLGALLGAERTHDADEPGPRGGRYSMQTPGGQRIVLDGHARSLVLSDGHGSLVEMGPDVLRVSAATDLVLEAPGHALTVRARTVDFEEAP